MLRLRCGALAAKMDDVRDPERNPGRKVTRKSKQVIRAIPSDYKDYKEHPAMPRSLLLFTTLFLLSNRDNTFLI